MVETIEYRKEPSGIRVFVDGRFVGWKCKNCNSYCSRKGNNKYGVCNGISGWSKKIQVIMAMDTIVRRFDNEDWVEPWLSVGVPDGLEEREDYEEMYPDDPDFDETYADLTALFCRLIARQTAYLQRPEPGTDFPATIRFNGDSVII